MAHQGPIPREAITRVAFFDPRENAQMAYAQMDASLTVVAHMVCGSHFSAWTRWMFGGPGAVSPNEFDPYLAAVEAQDDDQRVGGMKEFARQRRAEMEAVLAQWNVRVETNPFYDADYQEAP